MKTLTASNRPTRTETLPMSLLYPMVDIVSKEFLELVETSLKEEGLRNPLVILRTNPRDWEYEKNTTNPDILDPPDTHCMMEVYRVQCGNNRLTAAINLGYTHIDCIVLDDLTEAQKQCGQQRRNKEWKNIN